MLLAVAIGLDVPFSAIMILWANVVVGMFLIIVNTLLRDRINYGLNITIITDTAKIE